MLKVLPLSNPNNQSTAKCGEIFCSSFSDFTVYCTFCDIKLFAFDDFVVHIQNVHFENNLLKPETISTKCNQYLKVSVQNVAVPSDLGKDDVSHSYEINADEEDDEGDSDVDDHGSIEDETVTVLQKSKQKVFRKCNKNSQIVNGIVINEDINNHSFEQEYITVATAEESKSLNENSPNSRKKDVYYPCLECNERFEQKKDLDRHALNLHNGYKCSLCDKRFSRSYHLTGHLKTHTNKKNFICPMEKCGRGFTDKEYLKRHLEVHTMERTFICDYENCGKAFHTQRRLTTHKYTHRIPKKLVCDMCGYSCRSNTELTTHQRVHTGEKPYSCKVCNKPFISKTALTEHMISHSETRPHICQTCNAAFANRRVLVRHCYIHSDEKTFKCKLCDSAFKHPNSLQGHMRHVHREPKVLPIIAHSVM